MDTALGRRANGGVAVGGVRAVRRPAAPAKNDARPLRAPAPAVTTGTLTDRTLQSLLDTFGATITRKYIATIAWFSLLSLFLNGTRVPLETTDKIGDRTSPLP